MFDAKNNIEFYTAAVVIVSVLLTLLVCWWLNKEREYIQAGSVASPSFRAAHISGLLDRVKRPSDGMTLVDLELEEKI